MLSFFSVRGRNFKHLIGSWVIVGANSPWGDTGSYCSHNETLSQWLNCDTEMNVHNTGCHLSCPPTCRKSLFHSRNNKTAYAQRMCQWDHSNLYPEAAVLLLEQKNQGFFGEIRRKAGISYSRLSFQAFSGILNGLKHMHTIKHLILWSLLHIWSKVWLVKVSMT